MTTTRPLSVLIVEDNPDGAETMAALVDIFGHGPRIAHCGDEAIRLSLESLPDVVLLDIALPRADGCLIAETLCTVLSTKPLLVAVTGYTHLREKCRASGIDHYFIKPLEASALEELLAPHAAKLARTELVK